MRAYRHLSPATGAYGVGVHRATNRHPVQRFFGGYAGETVVPADLCVDWAVVRAVDIRTGPYTGDYDDLPGDRISMHTNFAKFQNPQWVAKLQAYPPADAFDIVLWLHDRINGYMPLQFPEQIYSLDIETQVTPHDRHVQCALFRYSWCTPDNPCHWCQKTPTLGQVLTGHQDP